MFNEPRRRSRSFFANHDAQPTLITSELGTLGAGVIGHFAPGSSAADTKMRGRRMTQVGRPVALLVSPDKQLAEFLRGILHQVRPSFSIRWIKDAATHDASLATLVVADCNQATKASLARLLAQIRAKAGDTPIVAVLRDAAEIDTALASGADEWIVRRSSRGEFIARIRYCRLRSSNGRRPSDTDRTLVLDEGRQTAKIGDVSLKLRSAEFKILSCLASNPGRAMNAPELLTAVLDRCGSSGSVRVHIVALRRALAAAGCGDLIVTDRGRGYRFGASRDDVGLTLLDTI